MFAGKFNDCWTTLAIPMRHHRTEPILSFVRKHERSIEGINDRIGIMAAGDWQPRPLTSMTRAPDLVLVWTAIHAACRFWRALTGFNGADWIQNRERYRDLKHRLTVLLHQ
jgi:hypothetical protein